MCDTTDKQDFQVRNLYDKVFKSEKYREQGAVRKNLYKWPGCHLVLPMFRSDIDSM